MTEDFAELLRLYSELQECSIVEQIVKRQAFSDAVHQVAAARKINHWELSAFVQKLWNQQAFRESKRKGSQPPPAGV